MPVGSLLIGSTSPYNLLSVPTGTLGSLLTMSTSTIPSWQPSIVYNARDYGMLFNGSDDSSAFNSLLSIACATGNAKRSIVFPTGTTTLTTHQLCSNLTIKGQGIGQTIINVSTTTVDCVLCDTTNGDYDDITLEGFTMFGPGGSSGNITGIKLGSTSGGSSNRIHVKETYIKDFSNNCVYAGDWILSSYENSWCRDSGQHGFFGDLGTTVMVKNVYVTGSNGACFFTQTATSYTFEATAGEYCTYPYWLKSTRNTALNAAYSEIAMNSSSTLASTAVAHIRLDSSSWNTFNSQYASSFAYLDGATACFIYTFNSDSNTFNNLRGRTVLGGADSKEEATAGVCGDDDSGGSTSFVNNSSVLNSSEVDWDDWTTTSRIREDGTVSFGLSSTTTASLFVRGLATSSIPVMNIASSTGASLLWMTPSGNIGIGTTTPGQKLSVIGTELALSSTVSNRNILLQTSGANRWALRVNNTAESGSNTGSNLSIIRYNDAGSAVDAPLLIDRSNGRIGLFGITGLPAYNLTLARGATRTLRVEDSAASTAGASLVLGGGNAGAGTDINGGETRIQGGDATGSGTSVLTFYTAGGGGTGTATSTAAERMRITGTGNVGIGTSTPNTLFQVTTSLSNATTTIEFGKAGQNKGTCMKVYRQDGALRYMYINTSDALVISASSCE